MNIIKCSRLLHDNNMKQLGIFTGVLTIGIYLQISNVFSVQIAKINILKSMPSSSCYYQNISFQNMSLSLKTKQKSKNYKNEFGSVILNLTAFVSWCYKPANLICFQKNICEAVKIKSILPTFYFCFRGLQWLKFSLINEI